jgi:hypothetical protein
MKAYFNYTGYNSEADVIKYADVLLSNKDMSSFFALPDSFEQGGLDANLVKCAVLVEATPVGLANFSAQGEAQEATVDSLLANTMLMRDMLVAGGASNGMYGQAASIYFNIIKASFVLSLATIKDLRSTPTPWDDRSQTKEAVLHRLAIATAAEHAVPVNLRFTQTATPPWGPISKKNVSTIDPIARYMHYEEAYLAGDLDPAFEVTTAFEMTQTINADATDGDLAWMRWTMPIYGPQYIAMNYSVGSNWRYAQSVHKDVAYVHTHCPQPNYTLVCSGHYSMIPAKGGICGFRAFWSRITRKAFGLPTWGAKHSGHAAMTSWNPQGWVIMLADGDWAHGEGFQEPIQSGLDFHLDTLARELRSTYQSFLRGSWVARARGDAVVNRGWDCDWGGHGTCSNFGAGGLWSSMMLYQKKATIAKNPTIPSRVIGPSTIPTKVDALIAKWDIPVPTPNTTVDVHGTIRIPAAAFTATTTATVSVMTSYWTDGTQVMSSGGDVYHANEYALVYEISVEEASTYYLTANHSTWHTDQDLMLTVNGRKLPNVPVYFTIGYWNQTQPVAVDLVKGVNTLNFTRLSSTPMTFKEFFLYKNKPEVPAPPGGGFTPIPISPPPAAKAFLLEPPTTSCILQGIGNVPEEQCEAACQLVANRTYTGSRPSFANVKGCFAIMSGQYKGNCNYNANATPVCKPPCGVDGNLGELCLTGL